MGVGLMGLRVYILCYYQGDGWEIVHVYNSRELAESQASKYTTNEWEDYEVFEFEVLTK